MIVFDFADPTLIYLVYNLLTFALLFAMVRHRAFLRKHDRTVLWVIFALLAYSQLIRYGMPILTNTFLVAEHLPFQTCRVSSVVLLYYLVRRDERAHPWVFYLTATGIWGVFITNGSIAAIPELTEYYFIDHTLLGLMPFYLLLVKDYRPSYRLVYVIPLALLTTTTLFIPINAWLGGEYFHLGNVTIARLILPGISPIGFFILLSLALFVYFNILYWIGHKVADATTSPMPANRPRSV